MGGILWFPKLLAGALSPFVAGLGLLDYSGENVRVNAVCPGVIDTPMVQRAGEESGEMLERMIAATPAGRLGEPEEITSAVVWLCSDDASFAMGHPFTLDGGLIVQ